MEAQLMSEEQVPQRREQDSPSIIDAIKKAADIKDSIWKLGAPIWAGLVIIVGFTIRGTLYFADSETARKSFRQQFDAQTIFNAQQLTINEKLQTSVNELKSQSQRFTEIERRLSSLEAKVYK